MVRLSFGIKEADITSCKVIARLASSLNKALRKFFCNDKTKTFLYEACGTI